MKLRIQKYNPQTDPAPYYVEGEVPWRENITAYDAIYLFHKDVHTTHYDHSCGGRICGRCACMIDGKPAMLCITVLDDSEHTIEPLEGFPVIRDLVVDKSSFDDCITSLANRVMLEPITTETFAPEGFVRDVAVEHLLEYGELCSRCGICNVTCPVLNINPDEYVGPAQMYAIGYRHLDWYDRADRVAQAVSSGLFRCTQCGTCSNVCPLMIDHQSMWTLLRDAAEERNLVPNYAK